MCGGYQEAGSGAGGCCSQSPTFGCMAAVPPGAEQHSGRLWQAIKQLKDMHKGRHQTYTGHTGEMRKDTNIRRVVNTWQNCSLQNFCNSFPPPEQERGSLDVQFSLVQVR